jgi:SAM-dependent methyltransferase
MRTDKNAVLTFESVITEIIEGTSFSSIQDFSICDVGCDDGQLLDMLKNKGFTSLTGIGYNISIPQDMNSFRDIDLSKEDWYSQIDQEYDCIISTDVIEHQTNVYAFLFGLRKLLKKDGTLILTFPNVHTLKSIILYALTGRLSGFFGKNFNDGHPLFDQHIFIPNEHLVDYLLMTTGFTIRKKKYINGIGRFSAYTTLLIASPSHL